jgi:hypothetical protein
MALIVDWHQTEPRALGGQTELIVPISGLDGVQGTDRGVVVQEISDANGRPAAFAKVTIDFEDSTLHLNVDGKPDARRIQQTVDAGLARASAHLIASDKRREHAAAQAREAAALREPEMAETREAFRAL